MSYKLGNKIKVLKGCSTQLKPDINGKKNPIRGKIIKEHEHYYLVQHKNFKECYSKASLRCKDTIFKIM